MRCWTTFSLASAALVLLVADGASAQQVRRAEPMRGGNENPPVFSDGTGRFRARLFDDRIEFRLRYDVASEDPDNGPSDVTQAHLHVGNPGNNGGIVAFLCVNPPLPAPPSPATTPSACPSSPGEVEGEIVADDVLADADGVLEAGDLDGLMKLIRQGSVYANAHTNAHGSGEVRGQVAPRIR